MTLPVEIETLLVARDAALEGRDAVAAELRAMVEVEFERTRHTHSTAFDLHVGRRTRWARRNGVDGVHWASTMRLLNDPTRRLRDPLPIRPHGLRMLRAATEVSAGDMLALDANGDLVPSRFDFRRLAEPRLQVTHIPYLPHMDDIT